MDNKNLTKFNIPFMMEKKKKTPLNQLARNRKNLPQPNKGNHGKPVGNIILLAED
jgi:hypothetical protein